MNDEELLLTPEEINVCFDKAKERWEADGKCDIYEFGFLWQYVVDEAIKSQLAKAQQPIWDKRIGEAKREGREGVISQIEAMDKRHSISFVLQALKEGEK